MDERKLPGTLEIGSKIFSRIALLIAKLKQE
jgi:hypothetical protein